MDTHANIPAEIKALKELLDRGGISQEEFDTRKRILLETPDEKRRREKQEKRQAAYAQLTLELQQARTEKKCRDLAAAFSEIIAVPGASAKREECLRKAEEYRKSEAYSQAVRLMGRDDLASLRTAREYLDSIKTYQDAEELLHKCKEKIALVQAKLEAEKKAKRKKTILIVSLVLAVLALSVAAYFAYDRIYLPWKANKDAYDAAYALYSNEEYLAASEAFAELGDFEDSAALSAESLRLHQEKLENAYQAAQQLLADGRYDEAIAAFEALGDYSDAADMVQEAWYQKAVFLYNAGEDLDANYLEAIDILVSIKTPEAIKLYKLACAALADTYFAAENYETAERYYGRAGVDYDQKRYECNFLLGQKAQAAGNYWAAIRYYRKVGSRFPEYQTVKDNLLECEYQYVISTSSIDNTYKAYLKDLNASDAYRGKIASIYKEVFAWHVEIYANDSEHSTRSMSSISRYSKIYWHIKLTGGDDGSIRLKYACRLPALSWSYGNFDGKWWAGNTLWVNQWYTSGGASGTAEIIVYNAGTGEELGRASVQMY